MRRTVTTVTALLGVWVLLVTVGVPATADGAEESRRAAPTELTIATFNVMSARTGIAWKPRRARVLDLLERTKADVVVLQEADRTPLMGYHRPDKIPGRKLPALWLARKAGMTLAVSSARNSADGRKVMWVNNRGPHVLYDPRKFTQVVERGYQGWNRGGGYLTLRERPTGRLLRFAALHLVVRESPKRQQERLSHLRNVEQIADGFPVGAEHMPITIWAGDFNTTDPAIARFMHQRGLVDTVKVAKKRTHHRINTFKGRSGNVHRDGERIDQIWVTGTARVDSWTQVVDIKKGRYTGGFASDHNPVVARVALPG